MVGVTATNGQTVHAKAARRAVAQLRAAKAVGEHRLAESYAAAAARAIDAHLAELRARERRLP